MKKVQPAVKKEIVLFDFGQTITVQAIIQGLANMGYTVNSAGAGHRRMDSIAHIVKALNNGLYCNGLAKIYQYYILFNCRFLLLFVLHAIPS